MPIKLGNIGLTGGYLGSTPIIKMYRGSNLVFQKVEDNQLPWVEANVKKFDYSTIAETEYATNGGYIGVGIILKVENLVEGEIISFTYDGVTKTIEYALDSNGTAITSGEVIFSDDVQLDEGIVRIESNIDNTNTKVYLCPKVAKAGTAGGYYVSCFNGGDVVGNYTFNSLLYFPNKDNTIYLYGYMPTNFRINTNNISTVGGLFNNSSVNVIIGSKVKNISNLAFGNSSGKVSLSSITFENTTNKKINIHDDAFRAKTASNYNVYIYDNDSALEYDWKSSNSGAKVYNNGVLLSQLTTPTAVLDGENIVITPLENASKYRISFAVITNGTSTTYATYITDLSNLTIPISSINGYENMVSGTTYTIVVKAYGKGYLYSAAKSLSYAKP